MATAVDGEGVLSQSESSSQETMVNTLANTSVDNTGDLSIDEVDLDDLNNDQSRIDSVLNFLLKYDCRKKNIGRPKRTVGRPKKQSIPGNSSGNSRRQHSVLPDEVDESLKT